jgi:hypothetical protein
MLKIDPLAYDFLPTFLSQEMTNNAVVLQSIIKTKTG